MAQLGYANFSNQKSLKNFLTKTRVEVWPNTSLLGNPSKWKRFDEKQRLKKRKLRNILKQRSTKSKRSKRQGLKKKRSGKKK